MKIITKFLIIFLLIIMPLQMSYAGLFIGMETGAGVPLTHLKKYFAPGIQAGINIESTTEFPFLFVQVKGEYYMLIGENQKLHLFPLSANVRAEIPWHYPVKPYLSAGGGIIWERLKKKDNAALKNYDPLISAGVGIQYLFKKRELVFAPYIEVIYHFLYQKTQKQAEYNGQVCLIHAGIKFKLF